VSARNSLLETPPYAVEQALKTLGADLRTARLRRNLSAAQVAEKIGVSRRVIADAERGKPSTGIAVYAAMLWTYGLVDRLTELANPATDAEGLSLSLAREGTRAGRASKADHDF